jgi:hypothetical protein
MRKDQYLKTYTNEASFTIATNRYINANYPHLRKFYFHIPNESATNAIIRIKLFNMGVLPGVPDFIFLKPQMWFMELKMPKGILSFKQKLLHEIWASNGVEIEICRTAEEVVETMAKQCGDV